MSGLCQMCMQNRGGKMLKGFFFCFCFLALVKHVFPKTWSYLLLFFFFFFFLRLSEVNCLSPIDLPCKLLFNNPNTTRWQPYST